MNERVKYVQFEEGSDPTKCKVLSACYTNNLGTATGFHSVSSQDDYPEVPEGMVAVMYFNPESANIFYELEDIPIDEIKQ